MTRIRDERPLLRYVHKLGVAEMDVSGQWNLVEGDELVPLVLNTVAERHGISVGSAYEMWSIFMDDEFNDKHVPLPGGKCYRARPKGEYYRGDPPGTIY